MCVYVWSVRGRKAGGCDVSQRLEAEQPDHTPFLPPPPPPPASPLPEICFLGNCEGLILGGRLWTGREGIGRGSRCVLFGGLSGEQKFVSLLVAEGDCKYVFIIPNSLEMRSVKMVK